LRQHYWGGVERVLMAMMIGIDGVFFLDKIEDFLEEGFLLGKKKHLNLLSANKLTNSFHHL
jgi:hypothetical protein